MAQGLADYLSQLTPSVVADFHQLSDVDSGAGAQHHSLGTSPTQAAPGDHNHSGIKIPAANVLAGTFAGAFTFDSQTTFQAGIKVTQSNGGLELGPPGTANTPYIDFHSSANNNDYDARLIASGGTSTVGQGNLSAYVNQFTINQSAVAGGQSALVISGNGSGRGAEIALADTTAVANPSKYLRANGGNFQVVNNGYNQVILGLSDAGALSIPAGLSATTGNFSSTVTTSTDFVSQFDASNRWRATTDASNSYIQHDKDLKFTAWFSSTARATITAGGVFKSTANGSTLDFGGNASVGVYGDASNMAYRTPVAAGGHYFQGQGGGGSTMLYTPSSGVLAVPTVTATGTGTFGYVSVTPQNNATGEGGELALQAATGYTTRDSVIDRYQNTVRIFTSSSGYNGMSFDLTNGYLSIQNGGLYANSDISTANGVYYAGGATYMTAAGNFRGRNTGESGLAVQQYSGQTADIFRVVNAPLSQTFFAVQSNGNIYSSTSAAFGGNVTFTDALYANGKEVLITNDSYLRINQGAAFTSGIWFGGSALKSATSSNLYIGSDGAANGNVIISGGGGSANNNRINLDGSTGNINVVGSMAALGNLTAYGRVIAGVSQGSVNLVPGGASNQGYMELYGGNGIRVGYIGNGGNVGSTDTGTINMTSGAVAMNNLLTVGTTLTTGGDITMNGSRLRLNNQTVSGTAGAQFGYFAFVINGTTLKIPIYNV